MASNNPPVIVVGGNSPGTNAASPTSTRSLKQRLFNVESVTQAVLWVGIISLVAIVVAVTAMVLDQFHFNNQTYRDQSDKTTAQLKEMTTYMQVMQNQVSTQQTQINQILANQQQ